MICSCTAEKARGPKKESHAPNTLEFRLYFPASKALNQEYKNELELLKKMRRTGRFDQSRADEILGRTRGKSTNGDPGFQAPPKTSCGRDGRKRRLEAAGNRGVNNLMPPVLIRQRNVNDIG